MKEGIKKGIAVLGVLALLAAAYWWGGNSPLLHGWSPEPKKTQQTVSSFSEQAEQQNKAEIQQEQQSAHETGEEQRTEHNQISVPDVTETVLPSPPSGGMTPEEKMQEAAELAQSAGVEVKGQFDEGAAAEGKPKPVDQEQQVVSDTEGYCTLSVTCESLLTHMDWLPEEKRGLVPADGVIFPATQVIFYEGENVFHVLRRELKKAGIHMEFTNTPVFRSAYIEGIQNLYEFDCGELSGWMYSVNGWFPNYGCSRYQIQNGDVIRWIYTCELGVDIGGYNEMY